MSSLIEFGVEVGVSELWECHIREFTNSFNSFSSWAIIVCLDLLQVCLKNSFSIGLDGGGWVELSVFELIFLKTGVIVGIFGFIVSSPWTIIISNVGTGIVGVVKEVSF